MSCARTDVDQDAMWTKESVLDESPVPPRERGILGGMSWLIVKYREYPAHGRYFQPYSQ